MTRQTWEQEKGNGTDSISIVRSSMAPLRVTVLEFKIVGSLVPCSWAWTRHFILCLVLVQLRKRPNMTENVLTWTSIMNTAIP